MNDLIPINILVADRTYRIKTLPKDEEAIRKTVKIINEKIIEYKMQFAGKDMQDYIAMVIVWFATQTGVENNQILQTDVLGELSKIESQLDNILSTQ